MQQVARIRPAGRREDLRAVTLADGRRFLLEAEQVTFLGLSPETAVDEGLERRLVNLDERIRAREAALTLLRYRLRSRAELTARLRRRGFSAHVIQDLVTDLGAKGMVDDGRFARAWAEHRAIGQNGPHRVRAELRSKGVASVVIDEAVRAVFGGDEAELAAALVERHLRRLRSLPVEVRLRRVAGLLRRRGFSGSVIAPLLRRYMRPRHQADLSGDASE